MGSRAHDALLRDPSPSGLRAEHDAIGALFADLPAEDGDDLDLYMTRRSIRFRLRTLGDRRAARNLELALVPYAAVHYGHARGHAIDARSARIPTYLTRLRGTLRAELEAGWQPELSVAEAFAQHELESAARGCEQLGQSGSARAYREFAEFIDREVTPAAAELADRLGSEEVERRLAEDFGVPDAAYLASRANEELTRLEGELRDAARARGAQATELADWVAELSTPTLEGDVAAHYRALSAELVTFLRERGLFTLPPDFEVALRLAPEGLDHGNWPCPVLDPDRPGAFLVDGDPTHHPLFWREIFAIHEGVPGHFLQSWHWQHTRQSPVRHLNVADDMAAGWQDWGPMVSIEGWAVYAEELMRREGFETGHAPVAVLVSHAIRAVRVLVDLGLQMGTMTREEAVATYTRGCWMPEAWARRQIVRHLRVPLQGLTYMAGRFAIEELEREATDAGLAPRDFRERLLSVGPVPPAHARAAVLGSRGKPR